MCMCKNCNKDIDNFIYSGAILVRLDNVEHDINVYDDDGILVDSKEDNAILSKVMELIRRDTGKAGAVKVKTKYFECPNCGEPV